MSPTQAAAGMTAAAARSAARVAAPAPPPPRRAPGPRRVSGPARPHVARPPSSAPFTQHVTRVVDHSLLDRLIRGRAWIGLVAFALIGIVAMQVTLLKLNAGIGSSIEQTTALQRESSLLTAQVAALSSAQHVQAEAARLGMVYPPPADVRYLHVRSGDASRAVATLVPPASGTTGASGTTASTSLTGSADPAASTSLTGSADPAASTSLTGSADPAASTSSAGSTGSVSSAGLPGSTTSAP